MRAPGVVFLHGFMSDMDGGKALFLERHCRERGLAFVRFDQFGHGKSSGAFEDGSIGRWAEDAVAVLDALTEGPQVLVGSSCGGWLMLLAAMARPKRVAGLVGIAAAPDFTEDLVWPEMSDDQRAAVLRDGLVRIPSEYSDQPYTFTKRLFDDGRRNMVLRDTIPFDGPVRLLHGQKDDAVPWQRSLTLMDRLRSTDVECTFIKAGDHRLSEPHDLARMAHALDEVVARTGG
ncbi:alpha/beta fold hydrolase [Novispirillum sp. DQ9]|uniref:alpha/beta fold hydrolase n=1 Tax=Novispirillum sp. DQ9 TaxID=3398612 RepID=UPI003C7BDAE1